MIALKAGRVSDIYELFPFAERPRKALSAAVEKKTIGGKQKISDICSAEQIIALAHAGLIRDNRKCQQ